MPEISRKRRYSSFCNVLLSLSAVVLYFNIVYFHKILLRATEINKGTRIKGTLWNRAAAFRQTNSQGRFHLGECEQSCYMVLDNLNFFFCEETNFFTYLVSLRYGVLRKMERCLDRRKMSSRYVRILCAQCLQKCNTSKHCEHFLTTLHLTHTFGCDVYGHYQSHAQKQTSEMSSKKWNLDGLWVST